MSRNTTEYYREWYRKNGRKRTQVQIDSINRWAENNPEKKKAHRLLNAAVNYVATCPPYDKLKIIKPKKCEECGFEGRIVGHHHDYSKPYDVDWLCASCHKFRHLKT